MQPSRMHSAGFLVRSIGMDFDGLSSIAVKPDLHGRELTIYRQAFEGQQASTFKVNVILVSDSN